MLFAISFTSGDLRVSCTGLFQRGGHFARIYRIGRKHVPDVHAESTAPFATSMTSYREGVNQELTLEGSTGRFCAH